MTTETVGAYIDAAPPEVAAVLRRLRETIRDALPDSGETISYHMPTVTLADGRRLTYYAGWRAHVALYAVHPLGGELEDEVAPYRSGKDTLAFPLAKPVPNDLVARVLPRLVELHGARHP
ncbi:DUF1801 domain-containing protein [Humibacter sp. BT305]|nr:DUF1801 domain-containing protein [Humibacter sp. BT305]